MSQLGKIVVVSAASGVGKTTIKDMVIPDFPRIRYSVSVTTRSPRPGEEDGVHYHFRTREQFLKMIEHGDLVEYQEVHGNLYGTPKSFLRKMVEEGDDVLLDLDVYGKVNFDRVFPEAIGILLVPPSMAELESRLRGRGTESEESLQLRLSNARLEMEFAEKYGKYEYTLVNDRLEQAVDDFRSILDKELTNKRAMN